MRRWRRRTRVPIRRSPSEWLPGGRYDKGGGGEEEHRQAGHGRFGTIRLGDRP